MMRIDLNETAKVLEGSDDILLLCHSHPDGDTLGSASALARALIAEGKRVRVECGDKIPKDFAFMFDGARRQRQMCIRDRGRSVHRPPRLQYALCR